MDLMLIREKPLKYIFKFAIPTLIGMLLTSLVSIIDGLFIGRYVGKDGLAAVNLGLPTLYIFLGVGIMIGIGGSTIAIKRRGAEQYDKAVNIFNQTIATIIVFGVLMAIITLWLFDPVIGLLGINTTVQRYVNDYYNIMILIYPVMMLNLVMGMFLRGEGKPQIFMMISVVSNIINITLDYIFIVKLDMGIEGAAYASVIAVILSCLISIIFFLNKKFKFKFRKFKFDVTDFKKSIYNGSSEFIAQISLAITSAVYNIVTLNVAGIMGVAAITIIGYSGHVFNMIVTGIGQGMGPIVSYCYGAKSMDTVSTIRKLTQKIVAILGVIIFILLFVFGEKYAKIFSKDIQLQKMVATGIKIYALMFFVSGYNIISSFFFTSLCRAKESLIISSMRGLIILLISILIFPMLFHETGIWIVAPFTEAVTFIISLYIVKKSKL
jgi:putative MATE family efflux protein